MRPAGCDLTTADTAAVLALDLVVRHLWGVCERLEAATTTARGLSSETDWQSKAATEFHTAAAEWAGAVSGLQCLAQTVRDDVARARDAARWAAALCL